MAVFLQNACDRFVLTERSASLHQLQTSSVGKVLNFGIRIHSSLSESFGTDCL